MASEVVRPGDEPVQLPRPTYQPGRNLTARPHPRVLVYHVDDQLLAVRLSSALETVEEAPLLGQVDLQERDCVVTNAPWAALDRREVDRGHYGVKIEHTWNKVFPPHMSIIYAPAAGAARPSVRVLDVVPASGHRSEERPQAAMVEESTVGTHVSPVAGLPDALGDLVRTGLAPAATRASKHVVFQQHSWDLLTEFHPVRPLLFGPGDRPIAATYARAEGSQVWLLPPGTDLYPWVLATLREWHTIDASRYPTVPGWQSSPKWLSSAESRLQTDLADERVALADAQRRFDEAERRIAADLARAAEQAESYERALVATQGELLASAVVRALGDLGFNVVDMDAVRPDGSRHEDFRLTDPDAPGWDCIGEIKGFTGGVKETGLTSLQRHLRYFERDEQRLPSAQWYVANSELRRDPDLRSSPLASSPEAILVLAEDEVPGLVVDTRALHTLLLAVQADPTRAPAIRAQLRTSTGVLDTSGAESFLAGAPAKATPDL